MRSRSKRAAAAAHYLIFLGPALVLYGLFVIRPLIETAWISLHNWDGINAAMGWAGLGSYARAGADPVFWTALRNNLLWVAVSIIGPMLLGLALAVLLSQVRWGSRLYSGIFFTPVVLNLIIVGLVWGLMYNPLIGPINAALRAVGLDSLAGGWLGNPVTVTPAIILAGNWTYFGFCMVVFFAGLQSVDYDLICAAVIDGANAFQRFVHVLVPQLANHITLLVVFSIIGSFKVFDIVWVMTMGGPNNASEVIATYMYWQSFMNGRVGFGAALAMVLTVLVAAASALLIHLRERP